MDIKAKIEELVKRISSDDELKAQFTKDPVKAVEKLLGVDLPDDVINQIVTGVKGKLTLDSAKGALEGLKKLF